MSRTWNSDWQQRIRAIVQGMGYEDVYAFVMSLRSKSFGELFGLLREAAGGVEAPVAFVQLPELFYTDAKRRGCLRLALMESLVRTLRQFLLQGWNRGKKARERRTDARARWPTPTDGYDHFLRLQDRIWTEIECCAPPDNWCPESRDDPIIQQAFARAWPADGPLGENPTSK
jgi:hypothetical protein